MSTVSRMAEFSILALLVTCASTNVDAGSFVSPTATLEYSICNCDLVAIEVALEEALQALDVEKLVFDERYKDVNPPDVLTVIGDSDGFDLKASNFAERDVLKIAIYQHGDDPTVALAFAKRLSDLLSNVMPCAKRPETIANRAGVHLYAATRQDMTLQ